MGGKPRQIATPRRGRPPDSPRPEGLLARWIRKTGKSYDEVAAGLDIKRVHLYALCREERRPSLKLAIRINEMAGDDVPLDYLVALTRKRG